MTFGACKRRLHLLSGTPTLSLLTSPIDVDDDSTSLTCVDMVRDSRLEVSHVRLLTVQVDPIKKRRTDAATASNSHSEPFEAYASTSALSGTPQSTSEGFVISRAAMRSPRSSTSTTRQPTTRLRQIQSRFGSSILLPSHATRSTSSWVDHPYIVPRCGGQAKATSALCAVNHQARDEFLAMLENAPEI